MSFPCLDSKVYAEVLKNLGDHEYVSFNLTGTERKILEVVHVIIERNGPLLKSNFFIIEEEYRDYIYCQLDGYQYIELNKLLKKRCVEIVSGG